MAKVDGKLKGTILVVDDEPGMRTALREVLKRTGWHVLVAEDGEQGLEILKSDEEIDLLMTDFRMPGINGLELLRETRSVRPALPSVMMTAYGTVEDAVCAMKEGANDYLLKPFSFETVTELVDRVKRDGENVQEDAKAPAAPTETKPKRSGRAMVASSPAMMDLLEIAKDVATADSTVLLTGESGTGKEVVARYIHEESKRGGEFVAVNCAALPESLLESELFGHEKGSFTGATISRRGRVEQAHGGTLLLDEISEMPLALQAKLLRVIQEKEVTPIGSEQSMKIDVRVIATSNRDLEKAVEEGDFRQDLYYRLNVISICLPPLRERREDIFKLADHFLGKYHRSDRPEQCFTDEVKRYMLEHQWPGNVRELENLVERACLLARGEEIQLKDLHMRITPQPRRDTLDLAFETEQEMTLDEMERRLIMHTLDRTGGNRTRTAEMLGVSVRTIRNKLNQYDVQELAPA